MAAGFTIVGVHDSVASALALPASWGCPVYLDLDEMLSTRPEIVVLCVPSEFQPSIFARALAAHPKVVVCEKPLAPTLAEAQAMADAARTAGIPVIVNYTRRFTSLYRALRARSLAGEPAMTATIRYAKGLRHNGTHALDLLRFLFGEATLLTPLAARIDCWPEDPSISCFLSFERCPEVFLTALDERRFTHFEFDLFTSSERFVVDEDHRRLRHWQVTDGVGIPPGLRLIEQAAGSSGYDDAMLALARHAALVARGAEAPLCTLEDGIAALRLADAIRARWEAR
jgi:predicted dehydrogenase